MPTCLDAQAQNGFLRKELGYKGLIVSDCDAVGDAWSSHHYASSAADATAQGIKAGCDQDCGSTYKSDNLKAALASGNLTVPDVDVALGRIMTMRFNLGMFDAAASVPCRCSRALCDFFRSLNDGAEQTRRSGTRC